MRAGASTAVPASLRWACADEAETGRAELAGRTASAGSGRRSRTQADVGIFRRPDRRTVPDADFVGVVKGLFLLLEV